MARRRWLLGVGLIFALVAPAGIAQAVCKPFCAGGGLVTGGQLTPGDLFRVAPFTWSLRFDGFVGGQSESPRRLTSTARLYGLRTSLNGRLATVAGTMTVFNEDSGLLFAVPLQITAVGTLQTNGAWSVDSAAIVPVAGGGGTGSSFVLADTELRGALHATALREESSSTAMVSTLSTPASFASGVSAPISGQVRTSLGTALPGVPVDILVDGDFVARVTTGQAGAWASSLTFNDALTHRIRAVAVRETPMATSSPENEMVPRVELTVTVTGAGTVTGPSISCSTTCTYALAKGTSVQLSATPNISSTFGGWSGACAGTAGCSVILDQARSVGATFTIKSFALSVSKAGSGTGTVTSSPAGISCGAICSATYNHGTQVTLTAAADASSSFTGWSGACSGLGACTTSMTTARSVTAFFVLKSFALSVSKAGSGTGTVTSSPAGISCGATCSASYTYGTQVTLTASPAASSTFSGWSGACSGTGSCVVTMDQARSVTATFAIQTFTLTVGVSGNGTVTSSPAGISCGATCSATFPYGTTVTLTATPGADSTFGDWSGDCYGPGGCSVIMTEDHFVGAYFWIASRPLTIDRQGAGNGTVTSTPAGISCGSTCYAEYEHGTQVTLTATPGDAFSTFVGWSGGGCSGAGTCIVTMDQSRTITATFALINADVAETEPNGTLGTADGIVVPTRYAGSAPQGDVDLVTFTLGAQTPVRIRTFDASGTGCASIDTVIRLLNADGSQRAMDDDGGIPLCSRIDALLPAGTYYVEVTPYGSTSIASYRLTLAVVTTADLYEPNNTRETAVGIGFGEPVMAAINPVGDLDFYRFTLASTGTIKVETFDGPGTACSGIDTIVRIFNASGTQVAWDDDSGANLCSLVSATLGAGTYTVSVEDFQNDHTIGLYRLSLELVSIGPPLD